MKGAPGFWRRGGASWPAILLAPLGWIYGLATRLRLARKGWRAPVPVISVGNFTLGGAGKTPTTIAIAAMLSARGERPYILSRGFGGNLRGPVRVDPGSHAAAEAGDEPLLMARHAPVIVARDRAAGARLAIAQGASVLVLDDALQNPALVKNLSLAVIDGQFGLGNGSTMPAGPLRAPVAALLPYIDAVILVGEDSADIRAQFANKIPVIGAAITPTPEAADIRNRTVFAFCGIALPEKFEATLKQLGAKIVASRHFPDHHAFSEEEAAALLTQARQLDAIPVTTEKDHVRLVGGANREELARNALPIPIRMETGPGLEELIFQALDSARRRCKTASGPA